MASDIVYVCLVDVDVKLSEVVDSISCSVVLENWLFDSGRKILLFGRLVLAAILFNLLLLRCPTLIHSPSYFILFVPCPPTPSFVLFSLNSFDLVLWPFILFPF